MSMYEIESVLDKFLNLADSFDWEEGAGIRLMSNGSSTTRETFKNELGLLLLSLLNNYYTVTHSQAEILDLMLDKGFVYADSDEVLQMAGSISTPYGWNNVSINAFALHDDMSQVSTGEFTTAASDAMISMFRTIGKAFIAAGIGSNTMAETQLENYIDNLETKASSARREHMDLARSLVKAQQPEEPKPAAKPAAKKTAAAKPAVKKTGTASKAAPKKGGSGGKQVYDEMISFMLPSGYQMDRETGDNGEEKVFIRFGPGTDDNGNQTWEFFAGIEPIEIVSSEEDPIPAGESPLQTVLRRNSQSPQMMLSEKLKAALLVRETPVNILGRILKFYGMMLMVERDDHHVVSLSRIRSWNDDDPAQNVQDYQHMIDLIGAIRINGEALPPFNMTAEELVRKMTPDFEGKTSIKGSIGLQIKNGDEVVSESVLVGDDDGNVHSKHVTESDEIADGKYGDLEIKDGWVRKCMKKAVTAEIPKGVVGIEDNAFEKCTKLEKVVIPDGVTSIGSSAFDGCTKLKEISIADSVATIGLFAFDGCKNLENVKLPASLTYISMNTFYNCEKLKSVTIPPSVTQIYSDAFEGCKSLTEVTLPDGLTDLSFGVFWGCEKLAKVNIPDGITEIKNNLFNGCKSLKSIRLPKGVTKIERFAFSECENLESIEIPDGVDEIGVMAFNDCRKLKKITIPPEVTVIDENLFDGCESLTEVILPESLDVIKEYAFSGCAKLKKCDIPAGVSKMESAIFNGCSSLERITIPAGVTEISNGLCNKCSSLKEVTFLGDIETIGGYAFSECSALTAVEFPDSLTSIGDGAFNNCKGLTSLIIPDGVESIGSFAFDDCDNLKEISMPGHDVELGGWALPDEDQARITYRAEGGRKTTRKPSSKPAAKAAEKPAAPKTAGRFALADPDDEIYTHYGKLKREHDKFSGIGIVHVSNNGREHEAIPLAALMERLEKTDNTIYRKLKDYEAKDIYELKEQALKIAQVFRVDESVFNSRHDDEGDIGVTMLEKKWKFSALRSFAWTLADTADREGKSIDDYDIDDLLEICAFIEQRQWLNYEAGSWFDALCGHPDIHVYYMPESMIADNSAEDICSILNYNPIVSLEAFRNDLAMLRNPMIRIHNKLLENRDRSEKLDSPASAVLNAWCSMVVSAETPFFSEDGPMLFFHSYPDTPLNTQPLPLGPGTAAPRKAAPKAKKEEPSAAMQAAASYEIVKGPDGKDRIKLGEYPIGEPIVWLVLENSGDNLLLLSEYGLDAKAFYDSSYAYAKTGEFGNSSYDWQDSTLRQWLNEDFRDEAFTLDEKNMLLEDTHDTYRMSGRGEVEDTPPVSDKVWLLSAKEGKKYFADQRAWICKATDFAKEQGAEIENGPMQCHWWLRSPGVELMAGLKMWAACAMADGNVKGWGITAENACVRPVIRVNKALLGQPGSSAGQTAAGETGGAKTAAVKPAAPKKPAASKPAGAKPAKAPSAPKPKPPKFLPPVITTEGDKTVATLQPNGIEKVPYKKYAGFNKAVEIVIPEGITMIESNAFEEAGMESVVLPKSLREISFEVFRNCKKLKTVELPDGLEKIGEGAFQGCDELQEIHLPDSLTRIATTAFAASKGKKGPIVHLSGELARRLHGNRSPWLVIYSRGFVIDGESWDNIRDYCKSYRESRNPAKEGEESAPPKPAKTKPEMTQEQREALCRKYVTENPKIEFGEKRFVLAGVLPKGAQRDRFPLARRIKEYGGWIEDKVSPYTDYVIVHKLSSDVDAKLTRAAGLIDQGGKVKIIRLKDVEKRMGFAPETSLIQDNGKVRTELPNPYTYHKTDPFAGSEAENGINFNLLLDKGPTIESGKYAHAYLGLKDRYLEIPEGVTVIDHYAFSELPALEIVKLPASLRRLNQGAFSKCPKLRKVIFREGLIEIGAVAFENCPLLTEVELPDSVEIISDNAFAKDMHIYQSWTVVRMTGRTAKKVYANARREELDPPFAKYFVIDGNTYSSLEDYITNPKPAYQAPPPKPASPAPSPRPAQPAPASRPAAAPPSSGGKDSILREIAALEKERDSQKGLFAGLKKKKIQKRIDELKQKLKVNS